ATDLTQPGTFPVLVLAPTPGGGTSNTLTFTVDGNLVPEIGTFVTPDLTAGGPATTLQVAGGNLNSASVVLWNGSPRPTTFMFSAVFSGIPTDVLTASLSAADIASPGTAAIRSF